MNFLKFFIFKYIDTNANLVWKHGFMKVAYLLGVYEVTNPTCHNFNIIYAYTIQSLPSPLNFKGKL